MSPSLRILESWRKNAREEYWLHQLAYYPRKIVNGYGQVLRTDPYPWAQMELIQQKVNEMAKRMEDAKRYGAYAPPTHLWGGR